MTKKAKASRLAIRRTGPKKRILLVEDHPVMREGLRAIINAEPDLTVCGTAENAGEAMNRVAQLTPDLAIMDITLPGKNGLELVKDLIAVHPDLLVLVFTMHDEQVYAERMLRAGAKGYVTKLQPPSELLKAVRQVLAGEYFVSQELAKSLLYQLSGRGPKMRPTLELLTDREFEIFQLFGEGKSVKEIARQIHVSDKTVAVHSLNVRQKLKLKNTAQLIRMAVQTQGSMPPMAG